MHFTLQNCWPNCREKKIGQNLKLKKYVYAHKTKLYRLLQNIQRRDEMRRTGTRTDRHKDRQTDKQGMDYTIGFYSICYDIWTWFSNSCDRNNGAADGISNIITSQFGILLHYSTSFFFVDIKFISFLRKHLT